MKQFSKSIGVLLFSLVLLFVVPEAAYKSVNAWAIVAVVLFALLLMFIPQKVRRNIHIAGVVTQYGLQEAFKRARNQIYTANLPNGTEQGATQQQIGYAQQCAANAVLSQSYLRLEQLIVANQNIFTFPILVNAAGAAAIRPTEVRLNQQDAFFCSNIAFYLGKATSATDVSFPIYTNPNATAFTLGATANGLQTIYNGQLIITINKSVIVPAYPMLNFYMVPQTQNGVGITAQTVFAKDQFDPSQISIWEPTINLIGTKQSTVQIQLPGNIATGSIDTFTYGIIELQGVLAQNVTLMS